MRLRGVARKIGEIFLEVDSDCLLAPAGSNALVSGLRHDDHLGMGLRDHSGMDTLLANLALKLAKLDQEGQLSAILMVSLFTGGVARLLMSF